MTLASPQKATPSKQRPGRYPGKRSRKMLSLADSLARLTGTLCSKQGFAQSEIITRWGDIVGPLLARHSLPERLSFPKGQDGGTVHILADSAFAVELQYFAPQILERINGYFGFPAVARMTIIQGPVAMRRRTRQPIPAPAPADIQAAEQEAAAIGDKNLRAALSSLGAAVIADSRRTRR